MAPHAAARAALALVALAVAAAVLVAPAAANVILLTETFNATYLDRSAVFGPRVNETGVIGVLIPARDFTDELACLANATGPDMPPGTAWIALVKRGECEFGDKVRPVGAAARPTGVVSRLTLRGRAACARARAPQVLNMQALGATAVIVGDNEYRNSLVPMGPEYVEGVEIPSSFVSLCTRLLRRVGGHEVAPRPLTPCGPARHLASAWASRLRGHDGVC